MEEGDPWMRIVIRYSNWYGDYGGEAFVDLRLRRRDAATVGGGGGAAPSTPRIHAANLPCASFHEFLAPSSQKSRTQIIAPHGDIKTFVGDPYAEPWVPRVHYSLHKHP